MRAQRIADVIENKLPVVSRIEVAGIVSSLPQRKAIGHADAHEPLDLLSCVVVDSERSRIEEGGI